MLFLSIHIYCSVEYFCGRTGHQNPIVLRLVFDGECASVHDDVGLAFATSGESCGYGRGARSCSTAEALAWDTSFKGQNEPSGRAVNGIHEDAYSKTEI